MMRLWIVAFGLAVMPSLAAAQIGNPAGLAPDTRFKAPGVPEANQTNYQDRLFAQLMTAGGLAEVDLGKLAVSKTDHQGIRAYAQQMIDSHGKANKALGSIAEKSRMPVPAEPGEDQKMARSHIDGLKGREFDLAYLANQVVEHQKAASLLAWEIGSGEDAALQRFAMETLPTVLEHLQMARDLTAELTLQAQAAK
ncbi:DUF4142 domain-containing protein [Mesorhizobium retamae]|uniref:DUF4142 domain-containing protein n=1 Tax=Mesorhizobium retamae TaxID=2912854 RepID=A0ABS9QLS5_9HYPH|nr:DUF4142 domain-containing protein [Mesorhizobium sp. IRAMC:0171]MCG7508403.1 DUF4142 domain-containing protein [Mesorhizobium sp. IRAMC:0171]